MARVYVVLIRNVRGEISWIDSWGRTFECLSREVTILVNGKLIALFEDEPR